MLKSARHVWLILGISLTFASPALGQMTCGRGKTRDPKICKGAQRDVRGCCKIPKRRKRSSRTRIIKTTPKAKACKAGQVRSEDTSGQCCYPGQYWSKRQRRCMGEAECPSDLGMVSIGEGCGCPRGQEINQYTEGHCCWRDQEWIPGRGCVGESAAKRAEDARLVEEQRAARELAERQMREDAKQAIRRRGERVGMKWIKIPSGSFSMGDDSLKIERPSHHVTFKAFELSETEVTVQQYRHCVEARVCTKPMKGNVANKCFWGSSKHEDYPINCISWSQARTYARWVGGDLPTEAQWEYAARGGQRLKYAGAERPDTVAWYRANSGWSAHAVRGKRPNGYGLYDMSGNLWEWTLDLWHPDYTGAPNVGDQPWGQVPNCQRRCRRDSSSRVYRGGGWYDQAQELRVTSRRRVVASGTKYHFLGFRVALMP